MSIQRVRDSVCVRERECARESVRSVRECVRLMPAGSAGEMEYLGQARGAFQSCRGKNCSSFTSILGDIGP